LEEDESSKGGGGGGGGGMGMILVLLCVLLFVATLELELLLLTLSSEFTTGAGEVGEWRNFFSNQIGSEPFTHVYTASILPYCVWVDIELEGGEKVEVEVEKEKAEFNDERSVSIVNEVTVIGLWDGLVWDWEWLL